MRNMKKVRKIAKRKGISVLLSKLRIVYENSNFVPDKVVNFCPEGEVGLDE